jgi:hypothetical protein
MREFARQLTDEYGIQVMVEPLDLARTCGAEELVARLDARGVSAAVLVNNAGFGLSQQFTAHDPERLRAMLQLNVTSLTELTHLIGRRMARGNGGHILLVASLAAYAPAPLLAAYAASKAYILSLGEALNIEMAPKVGVTVLSPGLMDTGFNAASGYETPKALQRLVLPTQEVATIGLDALFSGKSSVVPGNRNRLMMTVAGLLPRRFILNLRRRAFERQSTHGG